MVMRSFSEAKCFLHFQFSFRNFFAQITPMANVYYEMRIIISLPSDL